MRTPYFLIIHVCLLLFLSLHVLASPRVGFYLPDSVNEMTIEYRSVNNLIVLPVMLNDSVRVNLILDTGCRNIVLFGKHFQKLLKYDGERKIQFSGLGSGDPVYGYLSLTNQVSIHEALGENLPVVIVADKNLFSRYDDIHGVIGYDIFIKFEIELNPLLHTITFRPAQRATAPEDFYTVPLNIVDSRPIMNSLVNLKNEKNTNRKYQLMIDTGSTLGLLLKTTNIDEFENRNENTLGIGFNGPIHGYNIKSKKLILDSFAMDNIPTGIIKSPWHNYASIGMQVLKNYILILNYCKAYAGFKPLKSS